MHPENETRYLSMTVTDTPEQTKHIFRAMARKGTSPIVDLEPWRLFQRWLAEGPCEVTIPFADTLAETFADGSVRLRRDFQKVLTLIESHALIHRASRRVDDSQRVVAEMNDYVAVYGLVAELVAAGVEATVPFTVRETVMAVAKLTDGPPGHRVVTSLKQVADTLGIDKSSASRRVSVACESGYLLNHEYSSGKQSQLALGNPLPDDQAILPTPGVLVAARGVFGGCTVAPDAENNRDGSGESVARAL